MGQTETEKFDKRFSRLLMERGMTPWQMHKVMGVAYNTVMDWYLGNRHPTMSNLVAMSRALGVQPSELTDKLDI